MTFQICDPWKTLDFMIDMNKIKGEDCPQCRPECSNTIYEPSITTFPFEDCDNSKIEMSFLCNVSEFFVAPFPKKFASQLQNVTIHHDIFTNGSIKFPQYFNIRNYSNLVLKSMFPPSNKSYDAFKKDISIVEIYFRKSSIIQMGRQSRMSWIDYLSTVGGLLGLVLGMGFVSFIELVWLLIRIIAWYCNLSTSWIV